MNKKETIFARDFDKDAFLSDPAIAPFFDPDPNVNPLRISLENPDPELTNYFFSESVKLFDKGNRYIIYLQLDPANFDLFESKIQEYKDSVLNDVNNEDPKAKKFRAKNDSASFIDLVPDQPTKAAFQKLKEYIDLVSGE
jgi:hypothetical protein